MKVNIILIFTVMSMQLLLDSCYTNQKLPTYHENVSNEIKAWVKSLNSNNEDSLKNSYSKNIIKIVSNNEIITHPHNIGAYQLKNEASIQSIKSLYSVTTNNERGIQYEILEIQRSDQTSAKNLIIWITDKNEKLIELEFASPVAVADAELIENSISKRRSLWIDLCNAHNAERLVENLYSKDALYFNHKPVIKGRANLVQEYSYMNDASYSLHLEPLIHEVVNDKIVFEVGQCSGTYNGKYILVWEKNSKNIWEIIFDSNI